MLVLLPVLLLVLLPVLLLVLSPTMPQQRGASPVGSNQGSTRWTQLGKLTAKQLAIVLIKLVAHTSGKNEAVY